jgi:hypothetical protein
MPDMKPQTIILHEGDKTALQYLGAAVVLQWSNIPEDPCTSARGRPPTTARLVLSENYIRT